MLKEKFEKAKAYISQPVPYMMGLHIITVICIALLTKATDFTFSLALTEGLSQAQKNVCIFLCNSVPFFCVALAALKAVDRLLRLVPEDQLLCCSEDTEGDSEAEDSELTLTIPLNQLLLIITIVVVTAVAVTVTFHRHIGFSSRLYNADISSLCEISTISL